ncbi:Septin-domain-containing protein [Paraphysoderma sedebokerense]|nr:Septin-domain-containing protein [Paraphysoderma sedebokerense]
MRLNGPLGIDILQNVYLLRKSKRKPYTLNIMVIGESGTGKSTFLNTLFNSPLISHDKSRSLRDSKTMEIEAHSFALEENGVRVKLTVVDTPGFGDGLQRDKDLEPIITYLDEQYDKYLKQECNPEFRKDIVDTRIHALIYFLRPLRPKLKEFDIKTLKTLCDRVNVIPVIAKADTLTPEEVETFKEGILADLEGNDIKIYPNTYAEDRDAIEDLIPAVPFAVVGSEDVVTTPSGKTVRGRKYRWGVVEVDNEKHCDFLKLQRLVISENMIDLIETTNSIHFTSFRGNQLKDTNRHSHVGKSAPSVPKKTEDPKSGKNFEYERQKVLSQMVSKEEAMRSKFMNVVKEKEVELKGREEALVRKAKELSSELEQERKRIETEMAEIEAKLEQIYISSKQPSAGAPPVPEKEKGKKSKK